MRRIMTICALILGFAGTASAGRYNNGYQPQAYPSPTTMRTIGNTTYVNDYAGNSATVRTIGNTTYINDSSGNTTSCRNVGNTTFCN